MKNAVVFGSFVLAATIWSGISAQQEMQPRPGPGSGVTRVSGSVTIDEMPEVDAKQRGTWRVGVTDLPEVRVAGPGFIRPGSRYEVTWDGGAKESIVVSALGTDGWMKVGGSRSRWVNLRHARAVEED